MIRLFYIVGLALLLPPLAAAAAAALATVIALTAIALLLVPWFLPGLALVAGASVLAERRLERQYADCIRAFDEAAKDAP